MLKKRKLTGGKVRVTFSMSALENVGQLYLVGEFNEWSETAKPMTKADIRQTKSPETGLDASPVGRITILNFARCA